MEELIGSLMRVWDLLVIVIGFSLIIVIHEFGHFAAARWAGIRVLAFAVGFGPAMCSFRKGMGLRTGSSEEEYQQLAAKKQAGDISSTEYRFNVLPFGGYVKMLGQDDADPTARSDEPDSYQNCVPWKRMVVISAGVVLNVVTAALLFIVVFMVGIKREAPVVGAIIDGTPAQRAVATNAAALGVSESGLMPGDRIMMVDGQPIEHFAELTQKVMFLDPDAGKPVRLGIERDSVDGVLEFEIKPEINERVGLPMVGVRPASSNTIVDPKYPSLRTRLAEALENVNMKGVRAGMELVAIDGRRINVSVHALDAALESSNGQIIRATFAGGADNEDGQEVVVAFEPRAELTQAVVGDAKKWPVRSLLGFVPAAGVQQVSEGQAAQAAGMQAGDVIARAGSRAWPSVLEAVREIGTHKAGTVRIIVWRQHNGTGELVDLGQVTVSPEGKIGFAPDASGRFGAVAAGWPSGEIKVQGDASADDVRGGALGQAVMRGQQIVRINDTSVASLDDVREAIRDAGAAGEPINLEIRQIRASNVTLPTTSIQIALSAEELDRLEALGWESTVEHGFFEPEEVVLRANDPIEAVGLGLRETKRIMLQTYATLQMMVVGRIGAEQIDGPIGIAHKGASFIAPKGLIWVLFFMAMVSVNLAVINFLPLPIVDGGHFLFLVYEQFTGRPPPVVVQNVAAIAGLALIGVVFLAVTFHDIKDLLG